MTLLNFCSSFLKTNFYSIEYRAKKATMFGLLFFILLTPGAGEFLCTSSDLEMSYTFCDSAAHAFTFNVTPCSIMNTSIWNATVTWIPRSDISFFKTVFNVWYDGANVLHWKEVLCSGADDEYSVCGTLKGETFATSFDIKGARIKFPKGTYNILLQAFSDNSENSIVMCLNFTMIVKQDAY